MNGYELAGAMRADPRTRTIVLIALTGYGQEQDQRRSAEAGFASHLVKPVDARQLVHLVDELGNRARAAAARHA